MSASEAEQLDQWERRTLPLLNLMPYVLLVISTALAVGIDHADSTKLTIDIAGSALCALWMLWLITLHPAWEKRRGLMGVFFVGLMTIAAVLVVNDPVYGFFSWTGYLWIYRVLDGNWRVVGLLSVATITGTSQHGGPPTGSASSWIGWVAIVALNCFVAGGVAWVTSVRDQQHELRVKAIEDLTEANAKLEASMRENAGLHEQLLAGAREAGVLDERQRMAREIHDTLAQGLVGIITQLEAAARGGPDSGRRTGVALDLARDSLAEARRSVQALAPAELDQVRLSEALTTVASKWSALSGVAARTTTTGTPISLRPEVEVALLRTAQEALANVAKHASAGTVALTLSYMDDVVSLDVRDDGVGFDPEAPPSTSGGGFGLTAMRQRVEGLSGSLAVESEPGSGTTIAAGIPVIPGSRVVEPSPTRTPVAAHAR
jgi:signal transduction histidine kinase